LKWKRGMRPAEEKLLSSSDYIALGERMGKIFEVTERCGLTEVRCPDSTWARSEIKIDIALADRNTISIGRAYVCHGKRDEYLVCYQNRKERKGLGP
jgi:hypothetical protein